jgi:hypothetical protein
MEAHGGEHRRGGSKKHECIPTGMNVPPRQLAEKLHGSAVAGRQDESDGARRGGTERNEPLAGERQPERPLHAGMRQAPGPPSACERQAEEDP